MNLNGRHQQQIKARGLLLNDYTVYDKHEDTQACVATLGEGLNEAGFIKKRKAT